MPGRLLVCCSHGAEDAIRVTSAYLAAVGGIQAGRPTALWLTGDGVRLATEGYAEDVRAAPGAPSVHDLHVEFTVGGGRLFVCPVSLDVLQLTGAPLERAAEVMRAREVLEWAGDGALAVSI